MMPDDALTNAERELLAIFRAEAEDYVHKLNEALLALEMAEEGERDEYLQTMSRIAHGMKGAARAVGYQAIEAVSHLFEDIFAAALAGEVAITPELADALYDGLDLIQQVMEGEPPDEQTQQAILNALATLRPERPTRPVIAPAPERPESVDTGQIKLFDLFQAEASEYLATLNEGLLRVETAPPAERGALLREMNRIAHSLKGAARAVSLGRIETIGHYMEEVFNAAQGGTLLLNADIADVLYDGLDIMQNELNGLPVEAETLAQTLVQLEQIVANTQRMTTESREIPVITVPDAPPQASPPPARAVVSSTVEVPNLPVSPRTADPVEVSGTTLMRPMEETIRVAVEKLDRLMAEASELLVAKLQGEVRERRMKDLRRLLSRWQRDWRSVRVSYIRLVRRMQDNTGFEMASEMSALFKFLETNQRYLTNISRELGHLSRILAQDNMHLATLADQLPDHVADLRMMPFETITGGFQRMVRDLARDTGKQVNFEISGAHIEIDKTVLDALKEPLMHLLRNAIDHGLEAPTERQAHGKSPNGHLGLWVEQGGHEIIITVADDGHGIDVNRVRRKAVDRAILTPAQAASLSNDDARLLIFEPGFTTSDSVTPLSGRGLGMDIVRTRVEGLRGRISLTSADGQGTRIALKVPVSLTRIRAILLRVSNEDYAIPSNMIARMESVPRSALFTAGGQTMVSINERPLVLAPLAALLDLPVQPSEDDAQLIILQTADRAAAFEVDRLYSEVELVLKPLGPELAQTPCVAGAALLGTGDIIIVLDANDLVRKASGVALPQRARPSQTRTSERGQRPVRVLVVDDSITTRTLEKNILEAVGFEVYVAIDGAEAWDMLADLSPDVIISDVEMPHMNGLELTRRIKGQPQTRDIPVILLTSLAKPEQKQAGLEAGADAYLVKSRFDQGELLTTIQSVL